ncbi:type VII secretion system-associated protein [Streptosporangium sp. NPDC000239]|uniref:Type VII secretion system-associated protein n=1 Tax=Streptosporangium jomthongense TaxID=1193683 RepID=A0ABV8FDB5_9ACTN
MNDVPPPPPLTDELRAQARRSPGTWLYAIDPFFDPGGEVPPYGVVGAWRADERGEITGEFRHNPNYRPSPVALGYPEPSDPLDAAVQLSATGYETGERIVPLLREAEVIVAAGPDGGVPVFDTGEGRAVFAYTAHTHLPGEFPEGATGWQPIRGGDLVALLPVDVGVAINPSGPAGVILPPADLRR